MEHSKVFHFIWYQGITTCPESGKMFMKKWQDIHPDYDIKFWDSESLIPIVGEYQYLGYWNQIRGKTELAGIVKKCDFARMLLLHKFGGGYIDMDTEPLKPVSDLFGRPEIYGFKSRDGNYTDDDVVSVDWRSYDIILNRENMLLDHVGYVVSNSSMFSKLGATAPLAFIDHQVVYARNCDLVLDSFGTWALTRWLRQHGKQHRALVLPPHYFMGPVTKHSVASHHYDTNWADKTKPNYWLT